VWDEGGILSKATRKIAQRALGSGLGRLAERALQEGGVPLDIELPDGNRFNFGLAPRVVIKLRPSASPTLLATPTLGALGEAYIEGALDLEGDMLDAIGCVERLAEATGYSPTDRTAGPGSRHSRQADRKAIAHHYDVGNDFYRLWLDERMVYSCAYFERGDESIDAAQLAKLDHICRKLRLAPGERLLDVGCGWGALLIHAATHYGVEAVGITLSEQQVQGAREHVARAGLSDRIEVLLLDYRDLPDRYGAAHFDKVASVGMVEHVGLKNLPLYFGAISRVLRDRGLFLNHGISSSDVESRPVGAGAGNFIDKYVFPQGEVPHLHVAVRELSAQGFEVADVESLRPHYALTLERWYRRLEQGRAEAIRLVGEKTLRTWRAYLAGCSYGFERGWMNIHQVLASHQKTPGETALPLTRRWIYA
jgi:cyclopropane-fatty-acyl-phospholipid synthase